MLFAGPVTPPTSATPTSRSRRAPRASGGADYLANGAINAGLALLRRHPALPGPGRRLGRGLRRVGDRADQKALSDLLADFDLLGPLGPATRGGMTVLKLDARIFNDTRLKTGRVLHFKNAGRDPRVIAKLERFRSLEERHPRALAAYLATRRAIGV